MTVSYNTVQAQPGLVPPKPPTGPRGPGEFQKGIRCLTELTSRTTSLAHILRVGITGLAIVEKHLGFSRYYTRIDRNLQLAESAINTVGLGHQIQSFGTKQYLKERIFASLAKGALLLAGIGGICVLIGRVAIHILEQIRHKSVLGLNKFKKIIRVLSPIGAAFAGLGFLLMAVDKVQGLALAKTSQERIQGMLDVAWAVSESTLAFFSVWMSFAESTLAFFSAMKVSHMIAMMAIAAITAGLGIAAAVYRVHVSLQTAAKESG